MCVATNAYGHARASIKLLVQEPPNFPRNLHIAEQGSRSLLLAWSSPSSEQDPAHASSPITNYIVQYKEAQGRLADSLCPPRAVHGRPRCIGWHVWLSIEERPLSDARHSGRRTSRQACHQISRNCFASFLFSSRTRTIPSAEIDIFRRRRNFRRSKWNLYLYIKLYTDRSILRNRVPNINQRNDFRSFSTKLPFEL